MDGEAMSPLADKRRPADPGPNEGEGGPAISAAPMVTGTMGLEVLRLDIPILASGRYTASIRSSLWQPIGQNPQVAGPTMESVAIDGESLYLARWEGGAMSIASGESLISGDAAPVQAAGVSIVFSPPLATDLAQKHETVITPTDDGAVFGADRVSRLEQPFEGRLVGVEKVAAVTDQPQLEVGGLTAGMTYALMMRGRSAEPSIVGTRIKVQEKHLVPPDTIVLPWREVDGVEFSVQGIPNALGTVYARNLDR